MGAHLSTTVAEGRAFMQLIDGKPVDSLSGARIDVLCPSDGKAFASIPASGAVPRVPEKRQFSTVRFTALITLIPCR